MHLLDRGCCDVANKVLNEEVIEVLLASDPLLLEYRLRLDFIVKLCSQLFKYGAGLQIPKLLVSIGELLQIHRPLIIISYRFVEELKSSSIHLLCQLSTFRSSLW